MFSFLERQIPAVGCVLYPGVIPPPVEQLAVLREPVTWVPVTPPPDHLWAVEARHPVWGLADIACDRRPSPPRDTAIDHALSLSEDEKVRARLGQATVG